MNDKATIQPGRYRHYKGNEYTVLGVARHSESLEELVVYRQEYGAKGLWVRPQSMFGEQVTVAGQNVPRFQPMSEATDVSGPRLTNLFAEIPPQLPAEVLQTILQAAAVRIERIVSHGQASPADFWYDQAQHEWVLVLQGAARLQLPDRTVELQLGDFINIPACTRHRVAWTTPDEVTIWLAVWYGDG